MHKTLQVNNNGWDQSLLCCIRIDFGCQILSLFWCQTLLCDFCHKTGFHLNILDADEVFTDATSSLTAAVGTMRFGMFTTPVLIPVVLEW